MTILSILTIPDERLHLVAKPVTDFDANLEKLAHDMAQTMYHGKGIGLAAIQVNVQKRVVTIDLDGRDGDGNNLIVLVNPEITASNGEVISEEGCLSVPGVYESVKRAEFVTVKFQDVKANVHTMECQDLMAVCVQHEIDHLNGRVFIEYLSPLKQNFIKKKMKKVFKPV